MPQSSEFHEKLLAMNEALMLGSLRQHELTKAAESFSASLQSEIAERRRAEAALRESEARLRQLNMNLEQRVLEGSRELGRNNLIDAIESLDHGLVLYDRDDRLVLFNHHVRRQYRLAEQFFVVGRTYEEIFRDCVESGAVAFPPGATQEQFIADSVALHKRADGAIVEVRQPNGRVLHIRHRRSRSQGIVAIGRDVTKELKRAEQLREAQRMQAIGRLTGGLAHDLNNFLAIVMGNLELLGDLVPDHSEASKLVAEAIGGALRGAQLTHSLLAFSGQQPLEPEIMDVGARLSNLTPMLNTTVGENIAIEIRTAPDLWPIRIDGAQLDTCVVNLAHNARDAMPNGGTWTIVVSNAPAGTADTTDENVPPCDHVLIEFTDTGLGMSRATLDRIFEPFFSTKGAAHGTGLGLSIAHGFVRQSDGSIRVKSTPREGTIVRIYLPRVVSVAPSETARPKAASLPRGRERILLVEDDEHVRATAAKQLDSLGYTVVAAENGDAALELLEQDPSGFDLLFSDAIMPGRIDGFELARIAHERWPRMRTLMASGFAGGTSSALEQPEGGLAVLGKPYRKAELARAVRDRLVG